MAMIANIEVKCCCREAQKLERKTTKDENAFTSGLRNL